MARKKFINLADVPYHITNRCINKEWFVDDMDYVWKSMCTELYITRVLFNIRIHSFVLMNNHYHLLASTPDANLSSAMAYFQRQISHLLNKKSGRINQLWARRFKRCELGAYNYFMNTYKYIYQNPVRAGLELKVEDYKYSSLPGLIGASKVEIPLEEDTILFGGIDEALTWLNQPIKKPDLKTIQRSLKRNQFFLPKVNGKDHPLENQSI